MNTIFLADLKDRLIHRLRTRIRVFDPKRQTSAFSGLKDLDAIQLIYVINLDRQPNRWRRVHRELNRFRDRHGEPLSTIARRFSAIDARYLKSEPNDSILIPAFTLAEQLSVDPNPQLPIDDEARVRQIDMTKPEIAIALSHIKVWEQIAAGDAPCVLVLEDDVFMTFGFATRLQESWSQLRAAHDLDFDLLYLSFNEVGETEPNKSFASIRRPSAGIWNASGYVLTREGAKKLLGQLPVHGPIDLWLNLQFPILKVFVAARPLIEQRIDEPSTNSYSILPVLSQVGVITREKPLMPRTRRLPGPVIAVGSPGSGLTALAKALSMIGYTCCSDLTSLPDVEMSRLQSGSRDTLFNAYVNIGSFREEFLLALAKHNPAALFVGTSKCAELSALPSSRKILLEWGVKDKWEVLSRFLGEEYPVFPYPNDEDLGQRQLTHRRRLDVETTVSFSKSDKSPWIVRPKSKDWDGIAIEAKSPGGSTSITGKAWNRGEVLDETTWRLRKDTFPSNLTLFSPANFIARGDNRDVRMLLREEASLVRTFTSTAVASNQSFRYGCFRAELRPSNVPGVITGIFLHRNGPRQEIDIEFVGKDTTKMIANVYYNPGPSGTKLEYGYRGTPIEIDLGFDAAAEVHLYEIDWQPESIRWKVDGAVVYERVIWDPTPIPDQPMEFNVNLWTSRSTEFAGRLDAAQLPASVDLRSLAIEATDRQAEDLGGVETSALGRAA